MKECSRCKESKPFADFHKDKQKSCGRRSSCKKCLNEARRAYTATPEGKAKQREQRADPKRLAYQLEWGRTLKGRWKSFKNKISSQGTLLNDTFENYILHCDKENCDVCGVKMTADRKGGNMRCVDHCHTTGKIRGALCAKCNSAEGYLKSDVEIVRNLLNYLENTNDGN